MIGLASLCLALPRVFFVGDFKKPILLFVDLLIKISKSNTLVHFDIINN